MKPQASDTADAKGRPAVVSHGGGKDEHGSNPAEARDPNFWECAGQDESRKEGEEIALPFGGIRSKKFQLRQLAASLMKGKAGRKLWRKTRVNSIALKCIRLLAEAH